MPTNKVKYGLSHVFYAVRTETLVTSTGQYTYTYATPKALVGAVSLNLDAQGEQTTFRADNVDYYITYSNNGYEGDLELAIVSDDFKKDCLGYVLDSNNLLIEKADAQPAAFALLFQFEGDANARRHVFYNCKATRPATASQTTGTTIEPVTETVNITAKPRLNDKVVKASSKLDDTSTTQYTNWFSTVQVPSLS